MNTSESIQNASEIIHAYAEDIAHLLAEEQDAAHAIRQSKQQLLHQAHSHFLEQYELLLKGLHSLLHALQEKGLCQEEIQHIQSKVSERKEQEIKHDVSDAAHIFSDQFLDESFQVAKDITSHDPVKGHAVFYALVCLSPSSYGFWIGLGTCAFLNQNMLEAAAVYCMMTELFPNQQDPYILAAQAFNKAQDYEKEKFILEEFLQKFDGVHTTSKEFLEYAKNRVQSPRR